jgi:rfaE bifunctional protein nucleotidyltransferase chain/domain
MESKIIPFEKLTSTINDWRKKNQGAIVLAHGCFDIVHPGHIRHLRFAAEQGDYLIVSITPDSCIQKGSNRPLIPQQLRAENLAALEMVKAVTIAPGETAIEPIKEIRPDVYVKGSEYATSSDPRFLRERQFVEDLGGKVAYSSGDVVFSSTEFIRDHELRTAEEEKLVFLAKHLKISRGLLNDTIHHASDLKIVVVGDAIIDEYQYCNPVGIAQQSPVLNLQLSHSHRFIGGACGLAGHLASLGAGVTFLSSVSKNHPDFNFFASSLESQRIRFCNVDDERRDVICKSHTFAESNQVLQIEQGKCRPLYSNLRVQVQRQFRALLKEKPNAVILSDHGYGLLTPDLIKNLTETAHWSKIPVYGSIALTLKTQVAKFQDVDIFSATEGEIRSCLHDFESGLSVLVDGVYGSTEITELYLMLNDGSSIYFRRPSIPGTHIMESTHIPNLCMQMTDKLGRNEAFLAGIVLGRCAGLNEQQSIYLGGTCSAAHLRKIGNTPISREGLFRLLDERREIAE